MDVAAVVIAVVAVLISGGSLIYTRRSEKRAVRAEEQSIRADERASRAEARAEQESIERRQGRPIVVPGSISGGYRADRVTYEYKVQNAGQAVITGLWLWHEDEVGNPISTGAGGPNQVLEPSGSPVFMSVDVNTPRPQKQRVVVRWQDATGEHQAFTGIEPPPNA